MSYSIKPILNNFETKDKQYAIIIQVIYNKVKVYTPSGYRVGKNEFKNSLVVGRSNAKDINFNIKAKVSGIESRLIESLKFTEQINKEELKAIVEDKNFTPSKKLHDFVLEILRTYHLSDGRSRHYLETSNKLTNFCPDLTLNKMDADFLRAFEAHLRIPTKKQLIRDNNTIQSIMKIVVSILNKAEKSRLIDYKQFDNYKVPKYTNKIPDYLTEDEINGLAKLIFEIEHKSLKNAGMYFLLSCYTGYRLSDSKLFDYEKMVTNDCITLRTKKNKQIVTIPIHERLRPVLDYVKDHPLQLSEQKLRLYVKELCEMKGIRKVKFHAARHSWAMLLMNNGFSLDEVASTLGDSPEVARIYARVSNEQLSNKIKEKLRI